MSIGGEEFVGRVTEREAVTSALERMKHGRGAFVLVTGEAGIGKTTFVDETLRRGDVDTVWARARQVSGSPPLWIWTTVLDALVDRGWLSGDLLPPVADEGPQGSASGQDRFRTFAQIAQLLTGVARRNPFVIVVDDLQWADADSLAMLTFLAADLRGSALAIVATLRGRVSVLAPDLARPDVTIELQGLMGDDLADLLRGLTGSTPSSDDLSTVERHTAGNPFFVGEVARFLTSADQRFRWTGVLPDGVHALLSRRLSALPEASRELVAAGAVLGSEFDADRLALMLDSEPTQVLERLGSPMADGLVRDRGHGTFAFAHDLIREAALADLEPGERRRLHRRAALACEQCGHPISAAAIAAHLLAAGDVDAATAWSERAGEDAYARSMYADAAAWFERAVTAATAEPCGVLVRLGDALSRSGRVDEASKVYTRAADLARTVGDVHTLTAAALGTGSIGGGFEVRLLDDAQLALLSDALERVGADDPLVRSQLLARLSVASTMTANHDDRVRMVDEAVALARAAGHAGALATALGAWCDAHAGPAHVDVRLDVSAEMFAAALRSGDPELELLARRLRIVALMEHADVLAAAREVAAFARSADALRQPHFCWYARLAEGMLALLEGRIDDAERLGTESARLGRLAGSANAEMLADGSLLPMVERTRGGAAWLEQVVEVNRRFHESGRGFDTATLFAVGHGAGPPAVQRCLDALPPIEEAVDVNDGVWMQVQAFVGTAAAFVADERWMDRIESGLLPYGDHLVLDGTAAVCYGPAWSALGRISASRGDLAEARRRFERAIAILTTFKAPLLLAEAEAELAAVVARSEVGAHAIRADRATAALDRQGDVWLVAYGAMERRVRHTKGMADLAVLISQPGTDVHVFDLVAASERRGPIEDRGDAGPALDATARRSYEQRIRVLSDEIEDAEMRQDDALAMRLDDERAALLTVLGTSLGLSGRPRSAASNVERARKAVGMRVRDAIERLERDVPELGRHLRHSIRTGTYCSYRPEHEIDWRR